MEPQTRMVPAISCDDESGGRCVAFTTLRTTPSCLCLLVWFAAAEIWVILKSGKSGIKGDHQPALPHTRLPYTDAIGETSKEWILSVVFFLFLRIGKMRLDFLKE
jgi:hypothetical protein